MILAHHPPIYRTPVPFLQGDVQKPRDNKTLEKDDWLGLRKSILAKEYGFRRLHAHFSK